MTNTPEQIESEAVERFKAEWAAADAEGDEGNRVRRGLRAAGLFAPGDLTDEMIERAAEELYNIDAYCCGERQWMAWRELVEDEPNTADLYRQDARRVLAAARVAPVTPSEPSVAELEQVLGFPVADGHEPTDAHRGFCREHGHAADRSRYPSPRCARCGEERVPSPDREALAARLRGDILDAVPDDNDMQNVLELAAAALAVPPVVNEAKLENEIRRLMLEWSVDGMPFPGDSRPAFIARGLVERQREWLGDGR